MRLDLTTFAPDSDPAKPGVLTDCDGVVPRVSGLSAVASPVNVGLPALTEPSRGAAVAKLLDGSRRLFVGTNTLINEATGTTWTNRSRVGGYTTGAGRFRFETFGSVSLAANRSQVIQAAAVSASFADIATAPVAGILAVSNGFVMALNVNGGALGDAPDGWWCSGLFDHTIWTPGVASQATNGRIVDTPGAITAGRALGDSVVAYKANSMYIGRYVGPPIVWAWQRVAGDIGAATQEAVVTIGTKHFFIGPSDIYEFDGTAPVSIGAPLREWLFAIMDRSRADQILSSVDLKNDLVFWYIPSFNAPNNQPDIAIVYNFRTGAWGKFASDTVSALEFTSAAITYDGMGTEFATWDDLPAISYDSSFWLAGDTAPGVIRADNILYSLTGTPGASSYTTGDFGDELLLSHLGRVTPRYRTTPPNGSATNFYRESLGDARVEGATVSQSRRRFDFRRSSRWHSVKMDFVGPVTINGIDVDILPDSEE